MNNYPYPVLLPFDSSYRDEFYLKIEYKEHKFLNSTLEIKVSLSCNSEKLKKWLDSESIWVMLKIVLQSWSVCQFIDVLCGEAIISLPIDRIMPHDNISITALVVAANAMSIKWNKELIDLYPKNYLTNVRKNDVLAISNEELLKCDQSDNNFIKFKEAEGRDGKGISINLNPENYIWVMVGKEMNKAYASIKQIPNVRDVFNSHILFEVFVYIFIELAQNVKRRIVSGGNSGLFSTKSPC